MLVKSLSANPQINSDDIFLWVTFSFFDLLMVWLSLGIKATWSAKRGLKYLPWLPQTHLEMACLPIKNTCLLEICPRYPLRYPTVLHVKYTLA